MGFIEWWPSPCDEIQSSSHNGLGKKSDGEVADVRLPLGRQLEELDVIPLHSVDHHCKVNKELIDSSHAKSENGLKLNPDRSFTFEQRMVRLGLAHEPIDAFDYLTLGFGFFFLLLLLAQPHDCYNKQKWMTSIETSIHPVDKQSTINKQLTLLLLLLQTKRHSKEGRGIASWRRRCRRHIAVGQSLDDDPTETGLDRVLDTTLFSWSFLAFDGLGHRSQADGCRRGDTFTSSGRSGRSGCCSACPRQPIIHLKLDRFATRCKDVPSRLSVTRTGGKNTIESFRDGKTELFLLIVNGGNIGRTGRSRLGPLFITLILFSTRL